MKIRLASFTCLILMCLALIWAFQDESALQSVGSAGGLHPRLVIEKRESARDPQPSVPEPAGPSIDVIHSADEPSMGIIPIDAPHSSGCVSVQVRVPGGALPDQGTVELELLGSGREARFRRALDLIDGPHDVVDIPDGLYALSLETGSSAVRARRLGWVSAGGGCWVTDLKLPASGVVAGRVVSAATGSGAAGRPVLLENEASYLSDGGWEVDAWARSAVSSPEGAFEFIQVPEGTYYLSSQGGETRQIAVVQEAGAICDLLITGLSRVSGVLHAPAGFSGEARIEMSIEESVSPEWATHVHGGVVGEGGRFLLECYAEGSASIRAVVSNSCISDSRELILSSGSETELDLFLSGGEVDVAVIERLSGERVVGSVVFLSSLDRSSVLQEFSGEDGVARFSCLPPGDYLAATRGQVIRFEGQRAEQRFIRKETAVTVAVGRAGLARAELALDLGGGVSGQVFAAGGSVVEEGSAVPVSFIRVAGGVVLTPEKWEFVLPNSQAGLESFDAHSESGLWGGAMAVGGMFRILNLPAGHYMARVGIWKPSELLSKGVPFEIVSGFETRCDLY